MIPAKHLFGRILWIAVLALSLGACAKKELTERPAINRYLDTLDISAHEAHKVYQAANTKYFNLIHTDLDLRFDFEKQHVFGKAKLLLTPHFYQQTQMNLDAVGFEIHSLGRLYPNADFEKLEYDYDNQTISIKFDKPLASGDTVQIYIEYTAKPNENELGGSSAISSDKGLYFINPLGIEKEKPTQIWTQGETQANSKWFPTIDSPNQKTTQDFLITVDKKYKTLSNGTLIYSALNPDGTRTDNWVQKLAHAPYLAMLTIGEFAVIEDSWRDKNVFYYVEKDFEKDAKAIFNHTPEMLEYFSNLLDYDYPWDKYHQVVVRDYVSGAMENTGAVIFGEFVQKNSRELADDHNDGIVAHEMFHHWFGDLVTCESWSNLPLNESFATYGSCLWEEHIRSEDARDEQLAENLRNYLREAQYKQEDMIRFYYREKEDMFDSHSYAKGSVILHMLRAEVGDAAFFKSLNKYLTDNAFQAAEIHHLRLAFEAITGRDLNWFFNQWFLASGHPKLEIDFDFDTLENKVLLRVQQLQESNSTPVYQLPVNVDIYHGSESKRSSILVSKKDETFVFEVNSKPEFVNFDADKILLAQKQENRNFETYLHQIKHAPKFGDRYAAARMASFKKENPIAKEIFALAIKDKNITIQMIGIQHFEFIDDYQNKFEILENFIKNGKENDLRALALQKAFALFGDVVDESFLASFVYDSSYTVMAKSLELMAEKSPEVGLKMANSLQNESSGLVKQAIIGVYANYGDSSHNDYFQRVLSGLSMYQRVDFYAAYGKYLGELNNLDILENGFEFIYQSLESSGVWWIKLYGIEALLNLNVEKSELKEKLKKAQQTEKDESLKALLQKDIEALDAVLNSFQLKFRALYENESDARIKSMLEQILE